MVQRVSPGQPIPANWPRAIDWNDIGEVTEIGLRHHRTRDSAQLKQWILATDWVHCRNDSGGDRRAGEVLECGDYLLTDLDPFSLWFAGDAPTSPVAQSTHGILRSAMKSDQTGLERVQVSGCCRAWVNVTDEDHNFCNAEVDSHVLKSNSSGPHKIIYKPTGTGEKECVILLYSAGGGSPTETIRFTIASVNLVAGTAVVTITARTCGLTAVTDESGGQVTVYDPCGCFLDEPEADLIGRCGGAIHMDPTEEFDGCRWEFWWLCCKEC